MRICLIENCENKYHAKGYCQMHYARLLRHGDPLHTENKQHGMYNTSEYNSWHSMKDRCYNKNYAHYCCYGGRGITACERWRYSFINFFADMGLKPFKGAQIDRKDNDGNYEPGNCRWTTCTENNRNRSWNKLNMAKAKKIRNLYKRGNFTQKKLGELYGVCQATIGRTIRNINWIQI